MEECREGGRETLICCSIYLCNHWFIPVSGSGIQPENLVYQNNIITNRAIPPGLRKIFFRCLRPVSLTYFAERLCVYVTVYLQHTVKNLTNFMLAFISICMRYIYTTNLFLSEIHI